jgi:hypothetical protein
LKAEINARLRNAEHRLMKIFKAMKSLGEIINDAILKMYATSGNCEGRSNSRPGRDGLCLCASIESQLGRRVIPSVPPRA